VGQQHAAVKLDFTFFLNVFTCGGGFFSTTLWQPCFCWFWTRLYALCESLEEPLAEAKVGNHIIVPGTKKLNQQQKKQHQCEGRNHANPKLNLISVDSIYKLIAALADIGTPEGTYLFVRPVDDWGYLFSDIIDELAVVASLSEEEESQEEEEDDEDEAPDEEQDEESSDEEDGCDKI
jgi:hypothetical protein